MDGQQPVSQTPPVPVKKRRKSLFFLIALFGAILFFLGATLYLSQPSAPTPSSPTPTIAPSSGPVSSPSEVQEIENADGKACGPNVGGVCPGGYTCQVQSEDSAAQGTCIKSSLPVSDETGNADQQVACTLDAKLCPDGSSVGRVGPNCEFAACPGE